MKDENHNNHWTQKTSLNELAKQNNDMNTIGFQFQSNPVRRQISVHRYSSHPSPSVPCVPSLFPSAVVAVTVVVVFKVVPALLSRETCLMTY
ncbi:hypothetical protein LINGRAHAP2_LOCUS11932 [Linum grandiflorum]